MPTEPESTDPPETTPTGIRAIGAYLDAKGVPYEVLEHEPTMSAVAEARETDRPQQQVAKTLVLEDGGSFVLAVVPASERLDIHKLRDLLGATKSLRLATEQEIARDFPALEVGAVPPFGPVVPRAEVIDRRLIEQERIVCAGGDHRHSVRVDPREVARIMDATTADICED